jgi:hypothetical protein
MGECSDAPTGFTNSGHAVYVHKATAPCDLVDTAPRRRPLRRRRRGAGRIPARAARRHRALAVVVLAGAEVVIGRYARLAGL